LRCEAVLEEEVSEINRLPAMHKCNGGDYFMKLRVRVYLLIYSSTSRNVIGMEIVELVSVVGAERSLGELCIGKTDDF
jgi:hypothetical protein